MSLNIDYSPLKNKFKSMIMDLVGDVAQNLDDAEKWAEVLADDMAKNSAGLAIAQAAGNSSEETLYRENLEFLDNEMGGRVDELKLKCFF